MDDLNRINCILASIQRSGRTSRIEYDCRKKCKVVTIVSEMGTIRYEHSGRDHEDLRPVQKQKPMVPG